MAAIVCGVDDSPGALEAARVAGALSAGLGVRLVLVHIAAGWAGGGGEGSVSMRQGRQGADRLLERAVSEHARDVERRVEFGEPAEALARVASEEAATLIVVGERRGGFGRLRLRRSLADDLAATAPCPVVVVPAAARR